LIRLVWEQTLSTPTRALWTPNGDARFRIAEDEVTHDLFVEFQSGWLAT